MRIWERYFFREYFKCFFFILSAVFFLFAVIDYSSKTAMHYQHGIQFQLKEILLYYFYKLSLELKVLLPFSALIASIKVFSELEHHGELTALLTSGVKAKRLIRPFLIIGLLLSLFSLINEQQIVPEANLYLTKMVAIKKREGKKKKNQVRIGSIPLEKSDERLVYSFFEPTHSRFYDAVWIRSFDEIYRMKYLYPFENPPRAQDVEIIKRNDQDEMIIADNYTELQLPIQFEPELLSKTLIQPEELSISELYKKLPDSYFCESEKECQILTVLLLKTLLPWFSLACIIAPLPTLFFYKRNKQIYVIYAIFCFLFFFFYLLVEASSVLAKKQVLSPLIAMGIPFGVLFGFAFFRYLKLR